MKSEKIKYYISFYSFYIVVFLELLFYPFLWIKQQLSNRLSIYLNKNKTSSPQFKSRNPVDDEYKLEVCIHEWGQYPMVRKKQIKQKEIDCGLKYQIDRFADYSGDVKISTTITMSEYNNFKSKSSLEGLNVLPVNNTSMDFSGYSSFISQLPEKNEYVLLMNSSVSSIPVDFLDDYLAYLRANPEVGMLGISFSSKYYQTLIKNNFNPHIQSFFILSTSSILREVIQYNKGYFPGSRSRYKLSIIKHGEVRLNKIILKLGYKIAVIKEDGVPFTFYKDSIWDNGYGRWTEPLGDCRLYVNDPNKINALKR